MTTRMSDLFIPKNKISADPEVTITVSKVFTDVKIHAIDLFTEIPDLNTAMVLYPEEVMP